ncbi:hypothetical protein [Chondromyces crocatus]|uniref:PE-PGRS family protein n=1 Tax=Chondromyces crocatus TaxID=52 RepID=A0A0K1EHL3_CHOCO|nr:hypothetical protein [Chondromyces crocatus]AKT40349.1 uncharacterized protein CMC5_045020 [Chondromyces crocatus]
MRTTWACLMTLGLMTASLCLAGAGCGDSGSDGAGGSGAGTSATTASGAGGPGTGGDGGSGATGGAGGNGGQGGQGAASSEGRCVRGCTIPADCCVPGQPNCPSDQYPTNYTCDEGICGPPRCAVKSDCTASGQLPDYDCLVINGLNQCAEPCVTDADCAAPLSCTGTADDGTKLCRAEVPAFSCNDDAACNGYGICNEAGTACICEDSSQCTNTYLNTCALP